MIAVALWAFLNSPSQSAPREPSDAWYRSHLPVTLKVTQDVQVKPYSPRQRHRRGTLEVGGKAKAKAFTIKKGETFQMTKLRGEGECRIRLLGKEYDLVACWWLEGFANRESDIYQPVAANKAKRPGARGDDPARPSR
jgi:hypothetical protein